MKYSIFFLPVIFLFSTRAYSQQLVLQLSHENGIYSRGDTILLTVAGAAAGTDSLTVKIRKNYAATVLIQRMQYKAAGQVVFKELVSAPAAYIFEVLSATDTASVGLVAEQESYQPSTRRPDDFEAFWANEKKQLRALPMKVKEQAVEKMPAGFSCFDTEINCTGNAPVRGYFAKPVNAQERSLPIVLYVHAAGVKGAWCRSEPGNALRYAMMGKGALGMDINAHGMLNGQSEQYYDSLETTVLKGYAAQGVESKSSIYFRGMYLRLIRALDFLTKQPEWDGKRILVLGESQGGGQALVAAGLDERVGAVVATVPAMCDWGASLSGSKGGWPDPFQTKNDQQKMLAVLPYFDAVHILKNTKATVLAEIGLVDITCPSTGIYAALNQAAGKKIILPVPYRGHHLTQMHYKETWEREVYQVKEKFIKEYLQ